MPKLTLDVCHGENETIEDVLKSLTRDLNVTAVVDNPSGPACGWPVITFTGTYEELTRLAVRYESVEDCAVDVLLDRASRPVASAVNAARDLLEWIKD